MGKFTEKLEQLNLAIDQDQVGSNHFVALHEDFTSSFDCFDVLVR